MQRHRLDFPVAHTKVLPHNGSYQLVLNLHVDSLHQQLVYLSCRLYCVVLIIKFMENSNDLVLDRLLEYLLCL